MLARRVLGGLRLSGLSAHPGLLHPPARRTGFWTTGTPATWPNTWGFKRAWSAHCGTPTLTAGSSSSWIRSWSRAKSSSSAAGRPLAAPRACGRTSAHAPNSATRSRSGAFTGRCITFTESTMSLRTLWSMRRWTSRTAVAPVVPGDRAHTARCSRGSGSVGEDVTKRFPRGKWNSAINKKTGNGPRCSQGVVLRRLVSKTF